MRTILVCGVLAVLFSPAGPARAQRSQVEAKAEVKGRGNALRGASRMVCAVGRSAAGGLARASRWACRHPGRAAGLGVGTAAMLGVAIAPAVLARADEVIR